MLYFNFAITKRVKTKKLLHDKGSEAFSILRCSHNYDVIKERCNTIETKFKSSLANLTLWIGAILGVIITLLLVCVIALQVHKRRTKAKQSKAKQSRTMTDHSYVEINEFNINIVAQ